MSSLMTEREQRILAGRERKLGERERKLGERERKLRERERKLSEKAAEKQRKIAEKQRKIAEKEEKYKIRYEIRHKSILNMKQIAKELNQTYPEGFTPKQLTDLYINTYGNISPYTLEPVNIDYDISAAIRGIMEEMSPSSCQHWFRYGAKKDASQIAPWLFANKQLAIVNHSFGWNVTTKEMASARRQNKGKWVYIAEGTNSMLDWPVEKYGPLPTIQMLNEAAIGRKIGVRRKAPAPAPAQVQTLVPEVQAYPRPISLAYILEHTCQIS